MTQPPNDPGDNNPSGFPPPPGGYPPPQGFPPPQGGQGFPPPPQGGYPPPPGGGYGAPQYYGGPPPFNVGDAFSWAWNKFTKNAAALIVPMLAYAVVLGLLGGLVGYLFSTTVTNVTTTTTQYDYGGSAEVTGEMTAMSWVVGVLGLAAIVFVALVCQASYATGLMDIADGREVSIGSFFRPRNFGGAAVTALLVTLAVTVGYFLCILPGIAAAFVFVYAGYFAVDRNVSGFAALKASFETVKNNAGNSILTTLLAAVIGGLGTVLCYVGVLVTGPIAALVNVYAYRRLSGGQVAPPTP